MTLRALVVSITLGLIISDGVLVPARADLAEYVKKDDPAFAWSVTKTEPSEAGTVYHIKLTSQTWHGITWVHRLRIYEPAEILYSDAALLYITGGNHDSQPSPEDAAMGFGLAKLCGARVAVLPQVPNQPLLGDKTEDTLIAETFVRYLETKDSSWPLLFPMVKSAVRAMDALQEWTKREGKPVPKRFVVTGASKRGWTTWLTGATEPRVIAIAPMVIDTLNMKAQKIHSMEVWGKVSEEIDDYTNRGLTDKFDEPDGKRLWKMVDPYSYRQQLTLPKFLINGTNDRYWTLDALNIYWDDLKGPKSVVYLPNAGHNLAVNRDYALNGIGAFFRHNVSNRPWPAVEWTHGDGESKQLRLTIKSSPEPKSAKLWVARSDTLDFRDSLWESTPMTLNGEVATGEVGRPDSGFIALIGDVEFALDGIPYHLSTQVRQAGIKKREK
ncbi:MAG: PhoPQ-activated pathogenicity-related family protein [Isosphaeraceae bacterium]